LLYESPSSQATDTHSGRFKDLIRMKTIEICVRIRPGGSPELFYPNATGAGQTPTQFWAGGRVDSIVVFVKKRGKTRGKINIRAKRHGLAIKFNKASTHTSKNNETSRKGHTTGRREQNKKDPGMGSSKQVEKKIRLLEEDYRESLKQSLKKRNLEKEKARPIHPYTK